jgi:hypothetical protein
MILRSIAVLCFALLLSCAKVNNKPEIKFSKDSTFIIIEHIKPVSLQQISYYLKENPSFNKLISVYLVAENDSLENELVDGKMAIADKTVVFKPSQSFIRGKKYWVESYIDANFADTDNLLKLQVKTKLQPQIQLLQR